MIIDAHMHAFPDKLAERAMETLGKKAGLTPLTKGTVADLTDKMQQNGIDRGFVLNIATNEKQQRNVNLFAREINGDRLVAFGSVNPHSENALEELQFIHECGLLGVKFHPEYQTFDVADPRYYPIFEECARLGLIMTFHAGRDIAFPDSYYASPAGIRRLCDHLPKAKIIAAHMGGWLCWDEVESELIGSSCYLDTSFTLGYLDEGRMERMIKRHGIDRVLFGTDSPWGDFAKSIAMIDGMDFTSAQKDRLFYQNAQNLLSA